MASEKTANVGGIDPERVYPLQEFMRLAGMGRTAMRSARDRGLPVKYVGRTAFVCGADFVRWLDEAGAVKRYSGQQIARGVA